MGKTPRRTSKRAKQTKTPSRSAKRPKAPTQALSRTDDLTIKPPEFIKMEKNLTSLGFFTPSSHTVRTKERKTIVISHKEDGKRVQAEVTIANALGGLPTTADQDKYLAFQKIVSDLKAKDGEISNPIGFSSKQMLNMLNKKDAGANYEEISAWLTRMTATVVVSKGAVFLAGRRKWATDTFHVFERSVHVGSELEDGSVADLNYVWLSEWQLENLNNHYLLPIDLESYQLVNNHIAKALIPLLQVWLYASEEEGSFSKRYDEIAQILCIKQHTHRSRIEQQLKPSLDELVANEYLSGWRVEKAKDGAGYNVVFLHGRKYVRDRDLQRLRRDQSDPDGGQDSRAERTDDQVGATIHVDVDGQLDSENEPILDLLVDRGMDRSWSTAYVRDLGDADRAKVRSIVERFDQLLPSRRWKNPPGYLRRLLEKRDSVSFVEQNGDNVESDESKARLKEFEREANERASRELGRSKARKDAIDSEIAALPGLEWDRLRVAAIRACRKEDPGFDELGDADQEEALVARMRLIYAATRDSK